MPHYIAVIDGERGAYGASFPDCPGSTAMGETQDEAIANAGEALREWMADRLAAGLPAPAARSADELLDSSDTDGYRSFTLAAVPLLLDEGRAVRVNLSLDAGALAMIDAAAKRRGITRSAFLVSAARHKIEAEG